MFYVTSSICNVLSPTPALQCAPPKRRAGRVPLYGRGRSKHGPTLAFQIRSARALSVVTFFIKKNRAALLGCRLINRDPLHLVERYLIAGAIVELGGARTFVRGHGLGVLQRAAGFKISGDARGAEGMAADPDSACRVRRRGAGSCARRRRGSWLLPRACRCGRRRSGRKCNDRLAQWCDDHRSDHRGGRILRQPKCRKTGTQNQHHPER